jgi:hypothetical protein
MTAISFTNPCPPKRDMEQTFVNSNVLNSVFDKRLLTPTSPRYFGIDKISFNNFIIYVPNVNKDVLLAYKCYINDININPSLQGQNFELIAYVYIMNLLLALKMTFNILVPKSIIIDAPEQYVVNKPTTTNNIKYNIIGTKNIDDEFGSNIGKYLND